jgi:hypothetical protein
MANIYKNTQFNLTTTDKTDVYTCPTNRTALVKNVHAVNYGGSTRWTQFGYSHNKNLQFHMNDKWNEEKFIDSDPRNNMVEPKLVIDEYKKLDKKKPVAVATN